MAQKKFKRRQYIVDPDFQYRMIRKTAVMAALIIVMSLAFLTWINVLYGDIQLELVQPDPFATSGTVDTLRGQRTLLDLLWPVMAACVAIALVVTFFFGVLISHRMAGPIFRIRRTLREMADGDLRGEIRLRKKDEFKSLAESVNVLKRSLRSTVDQLRDLQRTLESEKGSGHPASVVSLERILSTLKTE